MMFLIPNEMK